MTILDKIAKIVTKAGGRIKYIILSPENMKQYFKEIGAIPRDHIYLFHTLVVSDPSVLDYAYITENRILSNKENYIYD